jgi:arginine decarboxylase
MMRTWSVADSLDLYQVREWGGGFFGIHAKGNVTVSPRGLDGPSLDLKELVDELQSGASRCRS